MKILARGVVLAGSLAIAACGGSDSDVGGATTGEGGGAGSGGIGTGGGTAGSGGVGTGGTGGSTGACDGYAEEPSSQSVEVTITNAGAVDRFLLVSAYECDPVSIERSAGSGYEEVLQSVGFQCGCECPGPPLPGPRQLRRIAPNASTEVQWDARELDVCVETVDCMETYGFEGTAEVAHGFAKPVPSGEYRITYQLFETVPPQCTEVADGYECGFPEQDGEGCAGDLTAVASFTLPTSGDVTADVSVD
ncbi:MAG: hypothetical protein JRI23_10845 [Deltaproteobacteria bacterium]|jgi:hypothetical protein|nr:hypothetical protein [Deltaproteobacteria bacterium]MBW2532175.1 hypothetical protein [Deltaproteobacteria bacterium]